MNDIEARIINAAQMDAKPPKSGAMKDITLADYNILKGFAMKHQKKLSDVIERFIDAKPEDFKDPDKRFAAMRDQAKLSLEIAKAGSDDDKARPPGDINVQVNIVGNGTD